MSDNARPIIIKRKKVIVSGGHHGGAWKVAYADFVTAMMAFFMLMWLLNATTEKQRKGLADYFAPTIAVARVSGGGNGAFGGDSLLIQSRLPQSGQGGLPDTPTSANSPQGALGEEERAELTKLATGIMGKGGESLIKEMALEHIITDVTDEGLVVEIFDLDGAPLFEPETGRPTQILREISKMLVEVFQIAANRVSISSHSRAYPSVLAENPAWDETTTRAHLMRDLMDIHGFDPARFERLTGYGQSTPLLDDPMAPRNNRLEVTLLRARQ
ncbi:flagellar motor protein MotB [Litoreibacter arenae]|uniref:Flagellar motor rotation protein MotB n=1 Tax=Litoreibacter arenae DSM 19593 TaxID=1123360 RepID=S9RTR3_9RHOB|nr:flagellar motor protein MotB [Litoreibacter arenae]EPX77359.1 Flagellar motor rotation protein MotB [Litoreibacter arenae DSM 19593]